MAPSRDCDVALVTAPKLKLVDQPSLIKFEKKYAAYQTKVEVFNKSKDEANIVHFVSIKVCIDPATLHALHVVGEI